MNPIKHSEFGYVARPSDDFIAAFRGQQSRTASTATENDFKRFREDFKRAFTNAAFEYGLLLKYSYFDTNISSWGGVLDIGDKAPWDILATSGEAYAHFGNGELRTINIALREGVLDKLPAEIHYISLGPGESSAFKAKDGKFLNGLIASNHTIKSATTIDINHRYALDSATMLHEMYDCDVNALKRDFFIDHMPTVSLEEGTPLVAIFGGTLQNMPDTVDKSRDDGIVEFFHKMNKTLPTAHVLMTVDATPDSIDPALVISPYQYSLENEFFVLNFMARAKEQNLLLDKDYNVLKHWKLIEPQWVDNAVNIYIEAKADHTLSTIDGDYQIKAGQRVSVSTSQKGPIEHHLSLLKKAGFNTVDYYPQTAKADGTIKYIIHAAP